MKRLFNLGKLINDKWPHAILALCATTAITLAAQTPVWAVTFKTLFSFDGTDGAYPYAGLIQATNGNLYGTTAGGGGHHDGSSGTVFYIAPNGMLTTLHRFDGTDGSTPEAVLIQAANGNLYGTTVFGANSVCLPYGCGTVFELTLDGTLTTLVSFDDTNGANPAAGLIQARNGNLYGTTAGGGTNGDGTVFQLTLDGTLTTLHSFDLTDGASPEGLIQARNGSVYGITGGGGADGEGTIFVISADGTLKTLYSFCSESDCADGAGPSGALIQATNGNLYGTTSQGGANGDGTVFKFGPDGVLTTLHSFDGADGETPTAGLVQATNGELCGTTYQGGTNGDGTVFCISSNGTFTTLLSFDGVDGSYPYTVLFQAINGNFYGTTVFGGAKGDNGLGGGFGAIFEIEP